MSAGASLFELALIFYFASAITSVVELFRGRKKPSRLVLVITGAGFVVHTASIVFRYLDAGHLPITSMHEASSFFAWCIVLIFFSLEYRYKIGIMSSFILPLVFILMLSSSILPKEIRPLSPLLQSYWLGIHTFFAFLGNAAFAVAFGIGIMYLLQEYYVKSKHLGTLFQRLPSLQVLDK